MKIMFQPVHTTEKDFFKYKFEGDKIFVEFKGKTEEYDFTNVPDGILDAEGIISDLELIPLDKAIKNDGILKVWLKFLYNDDNATDAIRFPDWIDSKDFITTIIEEDDKNG